MSRTLKVHLANASPDLVHDFRNFGEEVWSALREDYAVSIEEIDASTCEFHLREIPKREVRTVAARVRKLERYGSLVINIDERTISVIDGFFSRVIEGFTVFLPCV